ncbi:MAG: ribonuclease H-like domain-containing protein [Nitrospirae bacterium]|nr:ribonuclease H-like domain-containing protein [Nitrospirota bacterium]MBI3594886.1 ribonuclease H-like domain-containing protein [Nitrospirota bacterium]
MGDILVLDLETQKSFEEVNGRNFRDLLVSVVGLYSYQKNVFECYVENEVHLLLPMLESADLVIGFNTKRFDYLVLEPYFKKSLDHLRSLDILEEVQKTLGHRLSLDTLAKATLNQSKIGEGLDAIRYFRSGEIDKLKKYCLEDVRLTRDLYEYGKKNGKLYYSDRSGKGILSFSVKWEMETQQSLF